ncbi:outer membrane protein assembly factor [Marinilabiliaceae bacterium JC017]|nr:outer membrane protein assembly factor [Marinilabiliaceae bacterium JC017]
MSLVVFWGCRTTKYVPENQFLLKKVEIENTVKSISKEELKPYIRQKENIRILGFWKFHLALYNLSGRDSSKGFNKWLHRIGEAPVLYDAFMNERSKEQLTLFLKNKGYFQAVVNDTIVYPGKKKAKVIYSIEPGKRYLINHFGYRIEDDSIQHLVWADSTKSLLKSGKPFDAATHDDERERISKKLQDQGYFNFSKQYIYFQADSSIEGNLINDTLVLMKEPLTLPSGKDTLINHVKSKIKDVYFLVGFDPQKALLGEKDYLSLFDTLSYQGCYVLYEDELKFKPEVLINSNYIFPGQYFDASQVEKTQSLLSSLQLFRYINIRFKQLEETDEEGNRQLQCFIQLSPSKTQSYSLEIEGTNSSGNLGAAGNVKYQHNNLLNGAEVLDVRFRTATQNQFSHGGKDRFNTLEVGVDGGLTFPKFLMPFKVESFRKKYNPRTSVSLAYNYQRRPDYTRTIVNARLAYNWRSSRLISHNLSIVDFNLVNIPVITDDFWNYIKDTFLRYSYEDHLILNTNYTFVYNEQQLGRRQNFWFFKVYGESAGNILNSMVGLWEEKGDREYSEILGIRYAQYVKADIDLRYHHYLNQVNSFAYRFFLGVGYPYGNLDVLPFEKRYFSGGANSIRAWPVRGLGPGSYKEENLPYYNQTADIRLELNAEYRFKLFWLMEGALFADMGNIWSIKESSSIEGGLFKFDTFYKQIAVGLGTGLRLDFNYFIFRLDMGVKARDPSLPDGKRWIIGRRSIKWDDLGFNFAIGYPF